MRTLIQLLCVVGLIACWVDVMATVLQARRFRRPDAYFDDPISFSHLDVAYAPIVRRRFWRVMGIAALLAGVAAALALTR